MTDEPTIHRLIGDVAGVQADVRNIARSQSEQWKKLEVCMQSINECNRKLDYLVGHESRLKTVEEVIDDYRSTKNRALSLAAGIGLGVGGLGGAISAWVAKWLN